MSLGLLITYYNEKELLGRSLRALFDEKAPPEEVLVYDDCSQFPAEQFVPAHLKGRVRVIRGQKNLGPAKGRNILLKKSTATYIKFHDTDDELQKGWSDRARAQIQLAVPDVILFEVDSYREGALHRERVIGLDAMLKGTDPVSFAIHNAIVTSSAFYRREFLSKTGPYREDLWQSEDHEFHIRVLHHKPKLAIIEESVLKLHVREQSRSQKYLEVWQCRLQGLKFAKAYLATKYAQDLAEAAANVASTLFQLGDEAGAREAFAWASQVGAPSFQKRPWFYRRLAKWDPLMAERVGKIYRKLIPSSIRRIAS